MALGATAALAACPEFDAPFTVFPTGHVAADVTSADLDADGRDDLIVANYYAGSVSVVLGATRQHYTIAVRPGPRALSIADYDADGRLDLAIASLGRLNLRRGLGDGTFEPWPELWTDVTVITVVSGDFDADGATDLVTLRVLGSDENELGFWRGQRDGTFAPVVPLAVGATPIALAAAELDADAMLDLAIATPHSLVLWYGGDAAPAPPVSLPGLPSAIEASAHDGVAITCEANMYGSLVQRALWVRVGNDQTAAVDVDMPIPEYVFDIATADVDADGDRDLLLLGLRMQPLRRRPGGFDFGPSAGAGAIATAVAALQLDGDAHADAVVADLSTAGVLVLPGHGDGSFGTLPTFTTPLPQSVSLHDVDGDGRLDALFVGAYSGTLSLHRGDGHGGLSRRTDAATLPWPAAAVLADMDADGHADAVVASFETFRTPRRGSLAVHRGDGHGGFAPPQVVELAGPGADLCAADLNADAVLDVAVAVWDAPFPTDCGVQIFHGRGDGSLEFARRLAVGPLPMAVAAGDLDGDGSVDLVASFRHSGGDPRGGVSWWRGAPGAALATRADVLTGIEPRRLVVARVDADALPDVVVTSSHFQRGERGRVVVLRNTGSELVVAADVRCSNEAYAPLVADFDADGFADVAVTNAGSHTISLWRGDGTGALSDHCEIGTGPRPVAIAAGDLDRDGRLDLVAADGGAASATVLRRIGVITPVAVSGLVASRTAEGVRLEWQLGLAGAAAWVQVERASALDAPFAVLGPRLAPQPTMRFDDPDPPPEAWYRVRVETLSGANWATEPVRVGSSLVLSLLPPVVAADAVELRWALPHVATRVHLAIVDARGRRVRDVFDGGAAAGAHARFWDRRDVGGRRVARGIYWARLVVDGHGVVRRVPLVGR